MMMYIHQIHCYAHSFQHAHVFVYLNIKLCAADLLGAVVPGCAPVVVPTTAPDVVAAGVPAVVPGTAAEVVTTAAPLVVAAGVPAVTALVVVAETAGPVVVGTANEANV